jgi:molybdopterin converting factor subunit 1
MTVTVLLFGPLAETASDKQFTLELPDGATVAEVLEQIMPRVPSLSAARDHVATAVNMTYVDRTFRLKDGDELALIPPVSGG